MAIRPLNSVGGFSVGETPSPVILANGAITTTNANISGNLVANIVLANAVRTDSYQYADGRPLDMQNPSGAEGEIQFYSNGDFGASNAFVFSNSSNVLTVTGGANVGDLNTTGNLYVAVDSNVGNITIRTGSVISGSLIPDVDVTRDLGSNTNRWKDIWLSGNTIQLGNVALSGAGNTFTTQFANVYGNLTANTVLAVGDATFQKDVIVTGNLSVNGTTTYIDVTNLSVKDPIIMLGGSNVGGNAIPDGKDRGLLLKNALQDNTPVNQFIGWQTANSTFVLASDTTLTGEIVTVNSYGNLKADTVTANLTGTVLQASQTQITSLGILTGLSVNGNASIANTLTAGALVASNINYPKLDGTNGQILATDGSGNLSFVTVDTYKIANGTSEIRVALDGDVTVSVADVSNVVVVNQIGILVNGDANVTGTLEVGTLSAGNVALSNIVLGTTAIRSASLVTTATTMNQVIISLVALDFRAVEFFVKGEEIISNKYSVATLQAVHDGSDVDYSVYGTVVMGGSPGIVRILWNSGNIDLVVSPSSDKQTVWTTQYKTL